MKDYKHIIIEILKSNIDIITTSDKDNGTDWWNDELPANKPLG